MTFHLKEGNVAAAEGAPPKRTGTQSIERTVIVLRELATKAATGWALWDLAARCGLDRGTTHRILSCLVRERLVTQRESDRHYFLGPLVFELGVTLRNYSAFQAAARTLLRALARRLPHAVTLVYLRTGDDVICIAREGASAYTREGTGTTVGTWGPMLSFTGGAAMLITLPRPAAKAVMERNEKKLSHLGQKRLDNIKALVATSRQPGYVFSPGIVWEGINSFGIAICNTAGEAVGAVTVSGTNLDYPESKADLVIPELRIVVDALAPEADKLAHA